MYYLPFSFNKDKPPFMPDGYPWMVSTDQHDSNWIWVDSVEELQDSFDLSEYIAYQEKLAFDRQQIEFREFGEILATSCIDAIGAKNLQLEKEGTPADTTKILQQMGAIKELLKAGSLKTARTIIGQITPLFPVYQEILINAQEEITSFLQGGGYESSSPGSEA
jgi:hypothetical protein